MQLDEARRMYAEAQRLYTEGRFADALTLLDALDQHYAGSKYIMLAQAYCYAQLFQPIEAIKVCNRIQLRHDCPEAHELKVRLVKHDGVPPLPLLDEIVFHRDAARTNSQPKPRGRRAAARWIAAAVALALAAAGIAGYLLAAR